MLLTIDIGNTNISFGIFKNDKIIKHFDIVTKDYKLPKLIKLLGKISLANTVICSVVPKITKVLKRDMNTLTGKKPFIVGDDLKVPIKNLYHDPKQLGQDRLVCAYAAAKLYGSPAIIIDFGTAITFDAVSKNNVYLGGMIVPGLNTSLEALNSKTALLPKIKLNQPNKLIGKNTNSGMLSGMIHGFSSLTDGLVTKIKAEIGANAMVIITGGNAKLISKHLKTTCTIDPDLILKGLNRLAK